MYTGLHAKCPFFLPDFNELAFFDTDVRLVKFHGNPTSRSRIVPSGRIDTTKLIVAFRNVANVSKEKGCVKDETAGEMQNVCRKYTEDERGKGKRSKKKQRYQNVGHR
jgi:hypothetical protein